VDEREGENLLSELRSFTKKEKGEEVPFHMQELQKIIQQIDKGID
jgi:hypothetical protein